MRPGSVALLLLAACYRSPSVTDGYFTCATTSECPSGMQCCEDDGLCARACPRHDAGRRDTGPDGPPPECTASDQCDDGNTCTTDVCAVGGRCEHTGCDTFTCGERTFLLCPCLDTWDEARANCEASGGCLVTIESRAEDACITAAVTLSTVMLSTTNVWIGFHQDPRGSEPRGGWGWTCGSSDLVAPWGPGMPDDYHPPDGTHPEGQDCADLFAADGSWGRAGQWDDNFCRQPYRWVCQMP